MSLTRFRRLAWGLPAAVEVLQLKQEVGQHQEEEEQLEVGQQHQGELELEQEHAVRVWMRVWYVLPHSHQAAGKFLLKQEVVHQHQEEEEETESGLWQGRVAAAGSNESPAVANE